MRLIDADAFREDYALAERCEDCRRYGKQDCDYPKYSARDFCGWLDDAPTVGGWISVKDRLPEYPPWDAKWVLVWFGNGSELKCEAPVIGKYDAFRETWMILALADSAQKRTKVTHWMPLPEPPQEVSAGG